MITKRRVYTLVSLLLFVGMGAMIGALDPELGIAGGIFVVLLGACFLIPLLIWQARRDRRAQAAGGHDTFSCWSPLMPPRHLMELTSRFSSALQRVRMKGDSLGGTLTVDADGIVWTPSPWAHKWRRAETLQLRWDEVESVKLDPSWGSLRDPGEIQLRFPGGERCSFSVHRLEELAATLERVAPYLIYHD